MTKYLRILTAPLIGLPLLGGCDMLGPRASDEMIDAPFVAPPDTPSPDAPPGPKFVLPAGTTVPAITDNEELTNQIRVFDGLSDSALMTAGGVLVRSTGKAAGATVRYWSFGAGLIVDGFVASAPLYVLADSDGLGGFTPRAGHLPMIDVIPGDTRYSAIRRIIYVPVTTKYAGELVTSLEALQEALKLGLVGEPVPAGTWQNMPVVQQGIKLEVATGVTVDTTEVFGHGYRVGLFVLGGTLGVQPLRNNVPLGGQEARLLSGVATGAPPVLSTTLDAQPVFQYGIPAVPPTTTPNYTPIVTELDVRLATGIDPPLITDDLQLFKRATNGSISGYYTDNVASFTITTTVSNKQIQFVDGAP